MHYYSVFKDQPFWGERKLYSLNPDRVNGYVRILRRNFHRPRCKAPPSNNLRIVMVEVKPPDGKKMVAGIKHSRLFGLGEVFILYSKAVWPLHLVVCFVRD